MVERTNQKTLFYPLCSCLTPVCRQAGRIGYIRADAASYQAEIFNYCEQRGTKYAIGAHIDRAVREAILSIKKDEWRPYENGSYIAETVHCRGSAF